MKLGNIIDSFTIGGTNVGATMPGARLLRMLGTRIEIDVDMHQLIVPTPHGYVHASAGDTIVLYDDDTLEVLGENVI